jgi:CheY-like chemotaxis protein
MSTGPTDGKPSKIFTIVIADDDLDDQDFIRMAITEANLGFEINSVYNGLQLMDLLLKRESYLHSTDKLPDLVFLDLNMPLLDGFGVLTELQKRAELSHIPVFVLSTSRSPQDKKRALDLGARGFYTKAASYQELKKIISEVCTNCFKL